MKYTPVEGVKQRWDNSTTGRPLNEGCLFYLWAVVNKWPPAYGQPLEIWGVFTTQEKALAMCKPGRHIAVIIEIM